ncbi:MAG: PilZ domain-containing protein [Polyangiaceae bacterium]
MSQAEESIRFSNKWVSAADRPLAVLGSLPPIAMAIVRKAAEQLNVGIAQVGRNGSASAVLDQEIPMAVIASVESGEFGRACGLVRRRRALANVPVIGVTSRRGDLSFAELFQVGGDDLVDLADPSSLIRRIRALRGQKAAATQQQQNRVVIVGEELALYARAFSNAGLEPHMAKNLEEALHFSKTARFVLASDELHPIGGAEALVKARAAGSTVPWVVVAAPKRMPAARATVKDMSSVVVLDAFAPAENALFLANELTRPSGLNARASARLLFGTSCIFRHAGRDEGDDVGFTYNVSAKGVFVRTLAPLDPGDDVWLELWAPRSARRVRLAGRVVWKRQFGPDESATVPAGFAVRVDGGLPGDVERWSAGCAALQREHSTT